MGIPAGIITITPSSTALLAVAFVLQVFRH